MAERTWQRGLSGLCDLCGDYCAAYRGEGNGGYGVRSVRLCTDCADALADVVNERRVREEALKQRILADGRRILFPDPPCVDHAMVFLGVSDEGSHMRCRRCGFEVVVADGVAADGR